MDSLLRKLDHLKKRKHRRSEMMEHIKTFLREEQEDKDNEPVQTVAVSPQSSPAPSSSSSPLPSHSYDPASHAGKQAECTSVRHEEKSVKTGAIPKAGLESRSLGFTPIHPHQPRTTGSMYSPISSGVASPVSHLSLQPLFQPVPTHSLTLPLSQERAVTHDAEHSFQPQQLIASAPAYQHPTAPHGYLAKPHSQMQQVNEPTSFSCVPPYQTMMSSALSSQNVIPGFVPSVNTAAVLAPPQLIADQTVAPPGGSIPQRTLYSPPKPKIPDFTSDSEKEFANIKLALDNLLEPYPELSEKYKYHVLLEHLKLPEAQMIGQSCRHHPYPYSAAMQALQLQYGQPHQLAQSEIAAILTSPDVKPNDSHSFQSFALRVHLLVSMLLSLEGPRGMELNCCSHVDRLLSKLPKYLRDGFIEFLQQQGKLNSINLNPYNLQDFAGWLQVKAQQQRLSIRLVQRYQHEKLPGVSKEKSSAKPKGPSLVVYHGASPAETVLATRPKEPKQKKPFKVHCLFCNSKEHYITRCDNLKEQSVADLQKWISDGKRCWRCARLHVPEMCNLKKPCSDCGGIHLQVLHRIARDDPANSSSTSESRIYLTPASATCRVLLKVVPVLLHSKFNSVETYAVLDDGAQRTMILPIAVQRL